MKVKTLKANFKKAFGSTLRIYNGVKFAADDATLSSLAGKTIPNDAEVKANGNTKCGTFESKMKSTFNIKVQVATPDDSALVSDAKTLSQSGK